jgi:hemin uptake protein HemP
MYHARSNEGDSAATAMQLACHDARELIGEGSVTRIALDDQVYTLRITLAGKLILTK